MVQPSQQTFLPWGQGQVRLHMDHSTAHRVQLFLKSQTYVNPLQPPPLTPSVT